ncbi:hypothetical protein ACA910_016880 [Epithemia clementina (nom. ined.)]
MEQLLFAARKLVQSISSGVDDPEGHHPNLTIPDKWAHVPTLEQYVEVQDIPNKGKGFVAKQNLSVGTVLLVAKPIAMVLDSEEDDDEENEDKGGVGGFQPVATSPQQSATKANVVGTSENDNNEEDEQMEEDTEDMENFEDDDEEGDDVEDANGAVAEDDKDPRINELLLLEVLDQLDLHPNLWEESFSKLFPRTDAEMSQLPAWVCHDDDIFVEIENGVKELERKHDVLRPFVKDISKRLPLIIRYNILSIETCPELLSYPGNEGFSKLSGIGLFYLPSFFNHSKRPNCARYAIGDVMFFVANQDISAGTEVCISYIEHDILCESAYRRNLMLSMNFNDDDGDVGGAGQGRDLPDYVSQPEIDGPDMPVVDSDVQNELMTMNALERLSSIDELLAQALGLKEPEDSDPTEPGEGTPANPDVMETASTVTSPSPASGWFQCDIQNLRILKAITLEGLGQSQEALALWEEAIQFCDTKLPPLDENGIVVRVQAALTSWHLGDVARAQHHAALALQTHNLLFGNGGVPLFRIRMGPDLRLPIRPNYDHREMTNGRGNDAVTALWPYTA